MEGRITFDKPGGQTRIPYLAVHIGAGTGNDKKLQLCTKLQETFQIPLGYITKTYIPFIWLMEYPGNIGSNTITACFLKKFKPSAPVFLGNPEIVEFPGDEENRFTVNVITLAVPA
jgi:hypothetical protein